MAIEFKCSKCLTILIVGEQHVGKRAKCRVCSTLNVVPPESTVTPDQVAAHVAAQKAAAPNAAAPNAAAPKSAEQRATGTSPPASPGETTGSVDPQITPASLSPVPSFEATAVGDGTSDDAASESPRESNPEESSSLPVKTPILPTWSMKTADGTNFGPVDEDELVGWLAQGRIAPNYSLMKTGDPNWYPAASVFPQLAPQTATPPVPASGGGPSAPLAPAPMPPAGTSDPTPNDDATTGISDGTPAAPKPPGRPTKPHRGGSVLTMGLLGFLCGIFGILAILMGLSELKGTKAGVIDPDGSSMSKLGMILGIVSLIFNVIVVAGAGIVSLIISSIKDAV